MEPLGHVHRQAPISYDRAETVRGVLITGPSPSTTLQIDSTFTILDKLTDCKVILFTLFIDYLDILLSYLALVCTWLSDLAAKASYFHYL